jgi:DNA-binding Lrp family transcriptional regulator
MSKQQEQRDSSLIQSISQQLNLYDNLFPLVEDRELRALFALLRIYLARCDNPDFKREHMMIGPELMKRLSVTYFDPFTTPTSRNLREALTTRLHSIRKYRITKPEVVRRTLIACLYSAEKKNYARQKTYLDAFMNNAGRSFTEIGRQLGVTPQAVSQVYQSLHKSDLLRFYGYINYPAFKLRHFIAFFTLLKEYRGSSDFLRRLLFDDVPFTLSLNLDIYEGSSWSSFAIPNQDNELRKFKRTLGDLEGEVFQNIEICELNSFSTGSNLEFFDGKRWFFDPQLWTYGFFEFIKENKELVKKARQLRYSTQSMRFDKIDFLIANILGTDLMASHEEIGERLRQFGCNQSRPTITRRIRKLILPAQPSGNGESEEGQPAVYPYMTYWGLGLSNLSCYLIECSQEQAEELRYAVGYLPYYFMYRTDKGVLLGIKSGPEDAAKINYMLKGINEMRVVTYSNRFENTGVRNLLQVYELWDETSQRWACANDQLDFLKRYESLP